MAGGGTACKKYLIQDWNIFSVFYWKPVEQLETGTHKILGQYQTDLFSSIVKYFNGNEGNHCASQSTS